MLGNAFSSRVEVTSAGFSAVKSTGITTALLAAREPIFRQTDYYTDRFNFIIILIQYTKILPPKYDKQYYGKMNILDSKSRNTER